MLVYMNEHSLYRMIRKKTPTAIIMISGKTRLELIVSINPIKSMVSFLWGTVNSADPDQTPHNAASDLDLHCLLTACSI